jgi:nucleotide-binding universal stress UspA family protein
MTFRRILVGFDGSPASERALRLAHTLRAEDGSLLVMTVAETHYATHAGMDAVAWDETIRAAAERARNAAAEILGEAPRCGAELWTGHAAPTLLRAAARMDSDLICLGAHGHRRISGILLGSVATRVVHDAHCSILVARNSTAPAELRREIVVATHDSPAAVEAARAARALARSTGAHIREIAQRPVERLLEAGGSADLLIVGSRGSHGLRSIRSVAERVAHEAACPVLIVRNAASREPLAGSRVRTFVHA